MVIVCSFDPGAARFFPLAVEEPPSDEETEVEETEEEENDGLLSDHILTPPEEDYGFPSDEE